MNDNILIIRSVDGAVPASVDSYIADMGYDLVESSLHYFNINYTQYQHIEPVLIFLATTGANIHLDVATIKHLNSLWSNSPILSIIHHENKENIETLLEAGAHLVLIYDDLVEADLQVILQEAQQQKNALQARHTDIPFLQSPLPMWITDLDNRILHDVNDSALKTYGYERWEFLLMSPKQLFANEKDAFPVKANNKVHQLQKCFHKNNKGDVFEVECQIIDIMYQHGASHLHVAKPVVNHILEFTPEQKIIKTEREKMEMHHILNAIPNAIWAVDAGTGELKYGNQSFETIFRLSPQLVAADRQLFLNNIPKPDRSLFYKAYVKALLSGHAEAEFRYRIAPHQYIILKTMATLYKDSDDDPGYVCGITYDVTEERQLNEKVRQSEQNLEATINNTNDLIWSVDRELRIIYCNKAYRNFVHGLAGITPKPGDYVLSDWGSTSFIDKRRKDYFRALNGNTFTTLVEEEYGGVTMFKEINSSPIVSHGGAIVGVNCIARDISEQKKQLIFIKKQNKLLRDIAWLQSHVVRKPAANLLGLIYLLEGSSDILSQEIRGYVEKLKEEAQNLDAIIREMVGKANDINEHEHEEH
ncbi:MAG: PAS domain-containing protein [Chitinophagia bacterium]|nr:PAS domain-containing protein [Chitinophagia bacterium]